MCSWGVSRKRAVQRARTIDPTLGTHPATTAKTKSVQLGQPFAAETSRPVTAAAAVRVAGRSTRRCPYWSTRRDTCGPTAAADSAMVAVMPPARA